MKYVLFETPYPDCMPVVRIFEEITSHNEVKAEVLFGKPGLKVVSAGKIWFNGEGGCTCVHSSVSLGMRFNAV
jgi:CO dehydrogenase nickel-insertion accessory protein CooC1